MASKNLYFYLVRVFIHCNHVTARSLHFGKQSRASSVGVLVREILQSRNILLRLFLHSHETTSMVSEGNVTYVITVSKCPTPSLFFPHILLNLWLL